MELTSSIADLAEPLAELQVSTCRRKCTQTVAAMLESRDPDEDTRSPPPQPQEVKYGLPVQERPPFVPSDSSSNSDDAKDVAEKGAPPERSSKRLETCLGDEVLLRSLDPNRNDIAVCERNDPLSKWFSSHDDFHQSPKREPKKPPQQPPDSSSLAEEALVLLDDSKNGKGSDITIETKPPPPPIALEKRSIDTKDDPPRPLKEFELHPSKPILPAIQPSPQSTATFSPGNRPKLPSLQSALSDLSDGRPEDPSGKVIGASPYTFPPVPVSSPSVPRNEMAREPHLGQLPPPQIPQNPYSHLSPASSKDLSNMSSPVSQQSYWRPLKSDNPFIPSHYDPSPQTAKSPAASYPTPTDQTAGDRASFSSSMQSNGSMSSGIYKCTYPECTAPPFQTQYLLK